MSADYEPTEEELAAIRNTNDFETTRPKKLERELRKDYPSGIAQIPTRTLPVSTEAEQGILSSYLIAPEEVGELCRRHNVTTDLFHVPAYGTIFGRISAMWETGKPIDIVTLSQSLHDKGLLESCGGPGFVSQLFTYLPTHANALNYIEIVKEKATARRIITECSALAARAYEDGDNITGLLDDMEKRILAIREKRQESRGFTGYDVAVTASEVLSHEYERLGQISGISTGFTDLDLKSDGLHEAELIVLAARPSLGKTALAMNIAEHVAIKLRKPVGIVSLEMSKRQLSKRLIASYAEVNTTPWRYGVRPTGEEMGRIDEAQHHYAHAPLFFEEISDPTIQEIRAVGRRMKKENAIELMVIDSLSVMRSDSKQARDNRAREVSECSNGVKEMAKELGIPIILIAHVDRGVDRRDGDAARPRLSDLRESGSIEQDADTVWMIWTPSKLPNGEIDTATPELWIPKCRNGERYVSVPLYFQAQYARFKNAEIYEEPETQIEMPV